MLSRTGTKTKDLRPLCDEVTFQEVQNHETPMFWIHPETIFCESSGELIVILFPICWAYHNPMFINFIEQIFNFRGGVGWTPIGPLLEPKVIKQIRNTVETHQQI